MKPLTRLVAPTLVIDQTDVDTDQIIPARYLTTTERHGLGQYAFADWRYDDDGNPRAESVFNTPLATIAKVLVAGHNFGCGSSREHAPWALLDFGFRVVISTRIADIFRQNSLTCGLLPIEIGKPEYDWLVTNPGSAITVDVADGFVELADGHRTAFEMDAFSRHCFLNGVDPLGYLLERDGAIREYEKEKAA